jgi:hypothetical protein
VHVTFWPALLVNAIPHTIMGLAGKRGMTPWGGPDSSPAANLAWAGLNVLVGVAALGPRSWRRIGQRAADERLRAVTLGVIAMAAFAAAYELSAAATQHRRIRAALVLPPATSPWLSGPVRHGRVPGNPDLCPR